MTSRLAFAIETAWSAGRSTLSLFQSAGISSGAGVELKGDSSPLTAADRGAERLMREAIERAYPGEAILGEEEGETAGVGGRWVMDPIDGTKSFVAGVPLYGTLLAYEEDGEPVLGVCVFPALNEIVYAELGGGCFWNGRPCRAGEMTDLAKSVVVSGSVASLEKYGRMAGMHRLASQAMAHRTWGDAYGHALVATGRAAAMIDPIVERWDISAMAVIVREAGGAFTDFSGGEALVREAVSAAPGVAAQVLEAFAG